MRTAVLTSLALIALPGFASAQVERYEVGRRMKAFEAAWEATTDAARKKRALAIVSDATTQFLTFRLGDAARTLDRATTALRTPDAASDEDSFVDSLAVVPAARLVDATQKSVGVTVKRFYPTTTDVPKSFRVRATLGNAVAAEPKKLPATFEVGVEPVDGEETAINSRLGVQLAVDARTMLREVTVTRVARLAERLAALKKAGEATGEPTIERATLATRAEVLQALADGQHFETDFPAAKLLTEAEAIVAAGPKPYFTAERPGQFWLTVPTGKTATTPCRILVPKGLDPKKPVPVVVALHGMGGSENLFFEGYGAGCVVKACEKRGWICVSPRGGLGFLGGPPPVTDLVAKLGERYPINAKRVFVVGHSMGAAQAVELAQEHPGKFAAVAALGGGGKVRKPEAFAQLPVFVGVGEKDFANRGAKATRDAIAKASGEKLTFKEYPDVEHMVIVRAAVDDVFAGFDAAAK